MARLSAPATSIRLPITAADVRGAVLLAYVALFFMFLYLPIVLLFLLSFNNSDAMSASFEGVTLRWYAMIFSSPDLLHSISNSMIVGIVSSVVATAIATMLALGLRQEVPFKALLLKILLLPILVPGVVSGTVYAMFFGFAGIQRSLVATVIPVHITWVLPFAFLTIFPQIQRLDRSLEDAAMDLGATRRVVFFRIILPLIRPGVIATFLFGFTLSFDEFIRTFFVAGRDLTVPVYLWNLLAEQMAPFLPAMGVVVTVISVLGSLVGFVASAWARRKNA